MNHVPSMWRSVVASPGSAILAGAIDLCTSFLCRLSALSENVP